MSVIGPTQFLLILPFLKGVPEGGGILRFKSPVLDDSDTPFKKGGIRKTAKCVSPIYV